MQNVACRVLTRANVDDAQRTDTRQKVDHNSSPCTSCIGELKSALCSVFIHLLLFLSNYQRLYQQTFKDFTTKLSKTLPLNFQRLYQQTFKDFTSKLLKTLPANFQRLYQQYFKDFPSKLSKTYTLPANFQKLYQQTFKDFTTKLLKTLPANYQRLYQHIF